MFSLFRASPTALTAAEAEQWLFRHDQYLVDHRNKEPNVDHYYDEAVKNEQFREKFPAKTPEAIRRAVIIVFQDALAQSWLAYQDAEWSVDLASKNPKINITEVFPGLTKFERDEYKGKVRKLLELTQRKREAETARKQQEAEQASLQSRTVVVQSTPLESVRPVPQQPDKLVLIKQWYDGASDINIVQLCPNLQRIDPSNHREVVRQFLVQQGVLQDLPPPSKQLQREAVSTVVTPALSVVSEVPRGVDTDQLKESLYPTVVPLTAVSSDERASIYPPLPPQLVQQAVKDPYIPNKPFAALVELGELPKEPVAKRSGFSFFRRAEPAIILPQLDTKAVEQALIKAIASKEDIATASYAYIDGIRALIPAECSFKQRIAIYEQAIAKALKTKCTAYGFEYHMRTRAFTSVLWELAPLLRGALLDSEQNAAPVINGFLAIKGDLAKLHKFPYPEFITPEKLFISYALFGNEQPQLFPFMAPLRELQVAYQRAKEAGAEPALLNSIRQKWSQWAWAVEKSELIRLPVDLYKSPEPVDFLEAMKSMQQPSKILPSAPPLDEAENQGVVITPQNVLRLRREARAKRREEIAAFISRLEQGQGKKQVQQTKATGSQKPKREPVIDEFEEVGQEEVVEVRQKKAPEEASRFTKNYIEVLFEGQEPDGAGLKQEAFGLRYRLYKLMVLQKEANPWSTALWDREENLDRYFRPTLKISQMERQVVKPYINAYRDQKLIKAIHQVVRAVEARSSPEELQEVISYVPGYFFKNEVFQSFLARQAHAEMETLDPEMNNPEQSPIIAQAIVAWFDNRLSEYARLRKIP